MKRTKRYGGFRIGDRVRVKGKQYKWLKEGVVKALTDGYCSVYFKENSELLSEPVHYCFMPNELINLTRIEECERNKEQLDKFTRKHFNQSADEYLKEDMEMTKKIIRDFCKSLELPVFDWSATDFGEIQNDWSTKDLLKEEHLVPKSEMNERLKKQKEERLKEIHEELDRREREWVFKESVKFVESNKEILDEIWSKQIDAIRDLPSPYTRDVYSFTKDFD